MTPLQGLQENPEEGEYTSGWVGSSFPFLLSVIFTFTLLSLLGIIKDDQQSHVWF